MNSKADQQLLEKNKIKNEQIVHDAHLATKYQKEVTNGVLVI